MGGSAFREGRSSEKGSGGRGTQENPKGGRTEEREEAQQPSKRANNVQGRVKQRRRARDLDWRAGWRVRSGRRLHRQGRGVRASRRARWGGLHQQC